MLIAISYFLDILRKILYLLISFSSLPKEAIILIFCYCLSNATSDVDTCRLRLFMVYLIIYTTKKANINIIYW